jgi:hypothetical protein
VYAQLATQAIRLALRVPRQGLIDDLRKGPGNSLFEQVPGFGARRRQVDDPPLEHVNPRVQFIEGQFDRARLEARRLGGLYGRATGEPGD